MNSLTNHLLPLEDLETLQATILSAAISGNATVRSALPDLATSMEEPYRSTAATVVTMIKEGKPVNNLTVRLQLTDKRLARANKDRKEESLTPQQVMDLILASETNSEGAEHCVELFRQQITAKRREQSKKRVLELAEQFGDDPTKLQAELEHLPRHGNSMATDYPSEAELFLPFMAKQALLDGTSNLTGLDTGFPLLNDVTNGLDTGIYALSAIPGLGKTTMAIQISHQVAENNKCPVIIVSLEQSAKEIRLKILANFAKVNCSELNRNTLGLSDPSRRESLCNAFERYLKISPYLTIVEGDKTTTVDVIRDLARSKMAELNCNRCLIVIDYLQLLQLPPDNSKVEIRERVDRIVSDLRRLAREMNSPVLAISALNREGYKKLSLEGFKESGGIEYGVDVAIGMDDSHSNENSNTDYRDVELHILKNRNGRSGVILNYEFQTPFATFIEKGMEA